LNRRRFVQWLWFLFVDFRRRERNEAILAFNAYRAWNSYVDSSFLNGKLEDSHYLFARKRITHCQLWRKTKSPVLPFHSLRPWSQILSMEWLWAVNAFRHCLCNLDQSELERGKALEKFLNADVQIPDLGKIWFLWTVLVLRNQHPWPRWSVKDKTSLSEWTTNRKRYCSLLASVNECCYEIVHRIILNLTNDRLLQRFAKSSTWEIVLLWDRRRSPWLDFLNNTEIDLSSSMLENPILVKDLWKKHFIHAWKQTFANRRQSFVNNHDIFFWAQTVCRWWISS
jgi:hypothetical protein